VLTSHKHKQEQEDLWQSVRDSYEVLHGCPWPAPKPLYLLASPQTDTEAGLTYTVRTRIPLEGVESELAALFGRTGAAADFISAAQMVDGVVAFEDDADAETFGAMLEKDRGARVSVARCDSHELFRDVQGVQGVVVLIRRGGSVPRPHQLAAAVRGKPGAGAGQEGWDAGEGEMN
jgi:hypothetical protein